MSSDAAKNAYPDPPEGFTMAGEEARLIGLREAYDRGAREADPFERDDVREALAAAYDRGAREKAAEAWDEGLQAGCDRWMDAREFGDKPVNPYREATRE